MATPHPSSPDDLMRNVRCLLEGREPLLVVWHGSRLYGTDGPDSDLDLRVICLPHPEEILLGEIDFAFDNNPDSLPVPAGAPDIKVVSLARFVKSLGRFDIGALEMLFAADKDSATLYKHESFDKIRTDFRALVATGSKSLLGPARVNLGALMPDASHRDQRQRKLEAIISQLEDNAAPVTRPDLLDLAAAENGCELVLRQAGTKDRKGKRWEEVFQTSTLASKTLFLRVDNRLIDAGLNKDAFLKALGQQRGDAKRKGATSLSELPPGNVSHAVRIMRQITEIATTGALCFPRQDAPELKAIKEGLICEDDLETLVSEAFLEATNWDGSAMPFAVKVSQSERDALLVAMHRNVILNGRIEV